MPTTLYGASDDLIELDGDVYEEFNAYGEDDGRLVTFSNGVVLRIVYADSGVWRITPVANPDKVVIVHAPEDDDDNYSDVATIDEKVDWAVCGNDFVKARS